MEGEVTVRACWGGGEGGTVWREGRNQLAPTGLGREVSGRAAGTGDGDGSGDGSGDG